MNRNLKAYTQLTIAMILVGSAVVSAKLIVQRFPIFLASGISLVFSSLLLLSLLMWLEKGIPSLRKQDQIILFLQALTGVFLFRLCMFSGLKWTTATEAGIITSTTPAMIGLISYLFLKEKLKWQTSAGIGLAVFGILVINFLGIDADAQRGANPLLGNLLMLGAVICEGLFTIFGKTALTRVTPLFISTSVNSLGLLMFLPFVIDEAKNFDFSSVSWSEWLAILHYGISVSVFGCLFWFQGVSKVPASTAAVFTGILPISAVTFSYAILQEPFLWFHLLGGLCVLVAILLIAKQ